MRPVAVMRKQVCSPGAINPVSVLVSTGYRVGTGEEQSGELPGGGGDCSASEPVALSLPVCPLSGPRFPLLHVGHRMAPGSQALMRSQQNAGMKRPVGRSHSRNWKALIASTTYLQFVRHPGRWFLPQSFRVPGTCSGLLVPPKALMWS